jgi:hypothetical protein
MRWREFRLGSAVNGAAARVSVDWQVRDGFSGRRPIVSQAHRVHIFQKISNLVEHEDVNSAVTMRRPLRLFEARGALNCTDESIAAA